MKEIYGTLLEFPNRADITLYKRFFESDFSNLSPARSQHFPVDNFLSNFCSHRFVVIGRNATYNTDYSNIRSKMVQQISFPDAIPAKMELPSVKDVSIGIYQQYVQRAEVRCTHTRARRNA